MKYIINSYGQLKIQNHKRNKVMIVSNNNSREWCVNNITKLIAQHDNELKLQYLDNKEKERVKTYTMKDGAKALANIIFTECVGCGNTKIKKTT